MSINTGQSKVYNPNYPAAGVNQSSQQFRDNFAVLKTAIESLQSGTSTPDSVLNLTTYVSDQDAGVHYTLGFVGNAFELPSGSPDEARAGLIRYNTGNLEYHDGSMWRRVMAPLTEYMEVPIGTTASRPVTAVGGAVRYNVTSQTFEFFTDNSWKFRVQDMETVGTMRALSDPVVPTDVVNLRYFDRIITGITNAEGGISGNAATATKWANARTITLGGDLSGSVTLDGSGDVTLSATVKIDSVALGTDTTGAYVSSIAFTGNGFTVTNTGTGDGAVLSVASNATNANTANTIVQRDASGNFTAGTITAALTGSASNNVLKAGDTMTGVLNINNGAQTAAKTGLAVYRNGSAVQGVNVMSGTGDGATLTTWNGGLGSNTGIGFHCTFDNVTRGVFDTRTGTFKATVFDGEATSARYADVAERYESDAQYEPGTVVCYGGDKEITISDVPEDDTVAGVISTAPAYMMNSEAGSDETHPYVALVGRVPCKVVGRVRKGQMLTTSDVPGHAMATKTKQIGSIIGKALENKDTDEPGVIEIAVQRM